MNWPARNLIRTILSNKTMNWPARNLISILSNKTMDWPARNLIRTILSNKTMDWPAKNLIRTIQIKERIQAPIMDNPIIHQVSARSENTLSPTSLILRYAVNLNTALSRVFLTENWVLEIKMVTLPLIFFLRNYSIVLQ